MDAHVRSNMPRILNSRAQLRILKTRFTHRLNQFLPHELRLIGPRRNYASNPDYFRQRGDAIERAIVNAGWWLSNVMTDLPIGDVDGSYSAEAMVWMQREYRRWLHSVETRERDARFWSDTLYTVLRHASDNAAAMYMTYVDHYHNERRIRASSA